MRQNGHKVKLDWVGVIKVALKSIVVCYVDTAVCQLEDPHVGSYCRSCRHACIVRTPLNRIVCGANLTSAVLDLDEGHCGRPLYWGAPIRAESPIVRPDTHPLRCQYHDTIVSIDSLPLGRALLILPLCLVSPWYFCIFFHGTPLFLLRKWGPIHNSSETAIKLILQLLEL